MAFGSLTIDTDVYNSVGPGRYMLSTVGFGQPANMVRLSPGKKANSKAPTTSSITKYVESDIEVDGVTTRRSLSITVQVNMTEGFTTAQAVTHLNQLATLVAQENFLTRLMLGDF